MQAVPGLRTPLGCTDCKANFSSASLLLKHFAEHISGIVKKNGSAESESDDAPSEGLLEQSLRSPASVSTSSPRETSSSVSPSEEIKREKEIPALLELANINNNNISRKHLMYVKLDLQKRVENCVFNMAGSCDSAESDEAESSSKGESHDETVAESEDFNPLKFCVVTMEEGNERLDLGDTTPSKVIVPTVSVSVTSDPPQQQFKKYVCTYCNKRFGWSTDLKRHILTHTGERPFQCQLCGATFTRNFLLQKHVNKLHKNAASNKPLDSIQAAVEAAVESHTSIESTLVAQHDLKDSRSLAVTKRRKQAGILTESTKS